jgi:DNA gyrase subunit B
MYFGWNTERGVVHVVNELVSNGIDQFLHHSATRVAVAMDGDTITYSDDGPGLPYDMPGPGNVSLAEHYLTCYHTTATADNHAPHIHMLSRGLGLVCVNAISEYFAVKTWRSGCLWEQSFARGLPVDSPHIVERGLGKGTSITFRVDGEVFKAKFPCPRTMRQLIFEAAHLFPGVILALGQEVFHAPGGLADLASLYYMQATPNLWQAPVPFALHVRWDDVEVNVGVIGDATAEPCYRSWANGSRTTGHGKHVDGLRDALRSVDWLPAGPAVTKALRRQELRAGTRHSSHKRGVSWHCCPCWDAELATRA